MRRIILDLDDTICTTDQGAYESSKPREGIVNKLREYKKCGYEIVISTSRNVRTYKGNIGKINANTLPVIIEWLNRYDIPFDEIYVGKPWCGTEGFYVDDKSIRPSEFESMEYDQIVELLSREKS